MAKIIAGCKHCGHLFKIEELFEGIDVECPKCGENVVVSKVADRDERGLPVFSEDMDQILDQIYKRAEQMEQFQDMDQLEQMAETMEVDQATLEKVARAKGESAVRRFQAGRPGTRPPMKAPKRSLKKLIVLAIIVAIVIAGGIVAWSFVQKQRQFEKDAGNCYEEAHGLFDTEEYQECLAKLREFNEKYAKSKVAGKAEDLGKIAKVEAEAKKLLSAAKELHEQGKLTEAIQKLDTLINDYGSSKRQGEAAQLKKAWMAEKALKTAEADYAQAQALRAQGKLQEALDVFERLAKGNWEFAEDAGKAATDIQRYMQEAQALYEAGQQALLVNEFDRAIEKFQEALEKYPNSKAAPLAATAIENARDQKQRFLDDNFNRHMRSGKRLAEAGKWRKASEEFLEALKWKPNDQAARDKYTKAKKMADLYEDMILIRGGQSVMGSISADPDERPVHNVTLSDYYISKYPVTNEEYRRFVLAKGHRIPYVNEKWAKPYNWDRTTKMFPAGKDKHPVVLVSYEDAKAYCDWVGKELPTEAQWEKAARGVNGQVYPWGNADPSDALCNFNNFKRGTTPVGSYLAGASPDGVMDMAGNVWEWCKDFYKKDFYQTAGRGADPACTQNTGLRVLRGGSWVNSRDILRSSNRYWGEPRKKAITIGFRTALTH